MWTKEVCDSITGLLSLKENWNSYGSYKADVKSVNMAIDYVHMLGAMNVFPKPSVSLTPGGHVFLCWNWEADAKELSIEFCPEKGALVNFWDSNGYVDYDCIIKMEI